MAATTRRPARSLGIHDIIAREVAHLKDEKTRLRSRLRDIDTRLAGLEVARQTLDREGYSPPVGKKRVATRIGRRTRAS